MYEYKIKEYTADAKKQKEYWDTAIGLQQVDGLKPSMYLYELSEQHINGELSLQKVSEKLTEYYKGTPSKEQAETMECDLVSERIVELLSDGTISLKPTALKSIHRYLFDGLYDFAGRFRQYNIAKEEPILQGDSVKYANYYEIQDILDYDFAMEKQQQYSKMDQNQIIKRLSEFTSSIWQVHPFGEGNTRTTAVFMELYLNSIGFHVNNDMFKECSKYYRNALVRSNYANYAKGIEVDFRFLSRFYSNLLFDTHYELDNDIFFT
ncbi:MAG: Fic family protein [Lachnospiraceae bacterium]|jgi:fido (protein-threonine AMPylation protein)